MKIIYMLTDICNSNCLHCYKKRSPAIAREIAVCQKDVMILKSAGHQVIIAGAEILTNQAYLQIYQQVKQDYLLSNGIQLSQDYSIGVKLITHGIKTVCLSWHIGFQNVLNDISDDIIKAAIKNTSKAGLQVVVFCVISNRNYHLLQGEIVPQVQAAGVKELKLFQLLPVRPDLTQYELTEEQRELFFAQVKKIRQILPREILAIRLHGNFSATQLTENGVVAANKGEFCPAGKSLAVIETDNKIYPCPFLNQPPFQIGIWKNGQLKIERVILNDGKSCLAEKGVLI